MSLLGRQHAVKGECFGERSLLAAIWRRTLDLRLVTESVFGRGFFCGHYVLAMCTDETSADTVAGFMTWASLLKALNEFPRMDLIDTLHLSCSSTGVQNQWSVQ